MADSSGNPGDPMRSAAIEWLRFVCCLGIVAFHMQVSWPHVAISGLYAFSIITVALAVKSARGRTIGGFARARFRTLLVPWIFWSVFYAAVLSAISLRNGNPLFSWFETRMLLTGTVIHLWFLPFAFVASVAVASATVLARSRYQSHRTNDTGDRGWFTASAQALVCAGAIAAAEIVLSRSSLPAPLAQWISVLPGVPIGAVLAGMEFGDKRNARPIAVLTFCCVGACVLLMWLGMRFITIGYLVSVPMCAAAWLTGTRAGPGTLRWSKFSFGVYLLHPFFGLVYYKVIGSANTNLAAAFVCVATLLGTAALRLTPLKRVL